MGHLQLVAERGELRIDQRPGDSAPGRFAPDGCPSKAAPEDVDREMKKQNNIRQEMGWQPRASLETQGLRGGARPPSRVWRMECVNKSPFFLCVCLFGGVVSL